MDELAERKSLKRQAISDRLIAAKELGDLKENAEYHAARDEQGKNESRIRVHVVVVLPCWEDCKAALMKRRCPPRAEEETRFGMLVLSSSVLSENFIP